MSFTQEYQKKLTTADEAVKVVKSGDRLEYGWCVTTPVALDEALAKRMPDLENIQIHGGIVMRPLAITQIENPADHFTFMAYGWFRKKMDQRRILFLRSDPLF